MAVHSNCCRWLGALLPTGISCHSHPGPEHGFSMCADVAASVSADATNVDV